MMLWQENTMQDFMKHEDKVTTILRKAYTNMDLHTDGTHVKKTDWLLMSKLEEKNVNGVKQPCFILTTGSIVMNY